MSGRGLPSWYKYRAYGPVYEEIRLAEHAVRLGSIDTHDRRGDVLFLDSFEQGFNKWSKVTAGAAADVSLITTYAKSGGCAAKVLTSATVGQQSGICHGTPLTALSKLGIEAAMTFGIFDALFAFSVVIYTGSRALSAILEYNQAEKTLYYADSSLARVALSPTVRVDSVGYNFSYLKLVADGENAKYVRAILNGTAFDLTGIALRSVADTTAPEISVSILYSTLEAAQALTNYIDDVIITQNEPG